MVATNTRRNSGAPWQGVTECLAEARQDFGEFSRCAESVLGEVETVQRQLLLRAKRLEEFEQSLAVRAEQLEGERCDYAALLNRFEQQETLLRDYAQHFRLIQETLTNQAAAPVVFAETSSLSIESIRAVWQGDHGELFDRLAAMSNVAPSSELHDSTQLNALQRELSALRETLEAISQRKQPEFNVEFKQLHESLRQFADREQAPTVNTECLLELQQQLAAFGDVLEISQRTTHEAVGTQLKPVLQQMDSLSTAISTAANAASTSSDTALATIQGELGELRETFDRSNNDGHSSLSTQLNHLFDRLSQTMVQLQVEHDAAPRLQKLHDELHALRNDWSASQGDECGNRQQSGEILSRLQEFRDEASHVSASHTSLLKQLVPHAADMNQRLTRLQESVDVEPSCIGTHSAELRAEIEQLGQKLERVAEFTQKAVADKDTIAGLRNETQLLRRLADAAREQSQQHEQARAVVEAELDLLRTQSATWQHDLETEIVRSHECEKQWHDDLRDLQETLKQAVIHKDEEAAAAPLAASPATTRKAKPASDEAQPAADPVANSLMAQFAKLKKDSARRRSRGNG